jgi:hypothetical protein
MSLHGSQEQTLPFSSVVVPVTTTAQPNLTALRNPLSSLRRSIAVAVQSGSSSHQMTSEDSISLGGHSKRLKQIMSSLLAMRL